MRRALRARILPALLAVACLAPSPARAEPPKSLEDLHAAEAKALLPLLRAAVKEDFRRQALALAMRIQAADPDNAEAANVIRLPLPTGRQDGRVPTKPFLQKRDQVLGGLATPYAALAKATAAGGKAADAVPLLERALAYDDASSEAHQQLELAGRRYAGAWGSLEKPAFEEAFGGVGNAVSFPSEMDDDVWKVRMAWPESKAVAWRRWRLHTTLPLAEVGPLVRALSAQETTFVATFGTHVKPAKEEEPPTDLVLVPDAKVYEKLVDLLVWDRDRDKAKQAGCWYEAWGRRLLVLTPTVDNPWVGTQAQVLGQAARVLVRRHLGTGASGGISGRGTWVLEGIVGAYEGFVPSGADAGDVDPARCWRLCAAKALHADGAWMPWAQAFELDRDAADRVPKVDLAKLKVGGTEHDAKQVAPLSAQATALVVGLWKAEAAKGPKRLATLLEEIYKRDRLPDLDKTLGTGAGKAIEAATKALDLVP